MNLCIDQGNTYTKVGLFEADKLIKFCSIDNDNFTEWRSLFVDHQINNTIISSVGIIGDKLKSLFQEKSPFFLEFSQETLLPVQNLYESPQSLGKDRLAGVIGAYSLNPKNDILVIDAGTALTFDFINAEAQYLGGTISPGLDMRFKALHSFTKKLPLLNKEGKTQLLGKTTEEAIRSGVVNGILSEIESYMDKLTQSYPKLLVFLTGGNCFFFESKLKNSIFANQNLVLIGLNSIINYNAENK